jgi:hypothetical protein
VIAAGFDQWDAERSVPADDIPSVFGDEEDDDLDDDGDFDVPSFLK